MTEIKNETGTKKKLLIPVVVLMLLGVSLVGAAYAYSSSVSNSGNGIDARYLSIDLRTPDATDDIIKVTDANAVVFSDHYAYASGENKTDKVDASITTKKIVTYNLKVSSDTDWNTIKVTSNDIATLLGQTVESTITVGSLFKIYANVNSDSLTGAKEIVAAGNGEAAWTVAKTSNAQDVTVYVYLVALSSGTPQTTLDTTVTTTVRAASAIGNPDHNAEYFKSLFSGANYKFTLTFDASYVA
jgi:hypothetical protein